ncbi:MAG: Maf-like protein [Breznakibacter sp.]
MDFGNACHLFPNLDGHRIILASQSPRRQQLLAELGLHFDVLVKPGIDESFPPHLPVEEIPVYLARHKAMAYHDELAAPKTVVITADTIVAVDHHILGKPANRAEAAEMMQLMSNRSHLVVTGVAVTSASKQVSFHATTQVWFKQLASAEIDYYIDHYRPYDKAGGYGIQEWIGLVGIEKVEGSYFNVVGLPVQRLYEELRRF